MKVVLENLTKIFPSRSKKAGEEVVAVNDFTFEIPDGKLIGLLGPSGCGKSTTLYMISGLQKPTSGKIYFGEDDVTTLSPENRGVGLVFQNYALYPHMTVKQNILFPLQNLKGKDKLSKEEMLERAYNAAKLVQIDELMERKPSELSGGQQQRVAIARALVKMPRVLLLDEPLSNLDARLRLQTREEIRRIQRETNITTIFVTHDQEEAMSISDMIVVMKLGVVQQIGRPQDVYDSPVNLFVAKFLGTPPINVFNGQIRGGKVYIGEDCVLDAEGVEDQEVYVGIRPEGFILDENGPFHCELSNVEVMGRDVSVVSTNKNAVSPIVRSIIPSDSKIDPEQKTVSFSLKSYKTFVFGKEKVHWTIEDEAVTNYTYSKDTHTLSACNDKKFYNLGTLKTVEQIAKELEAEKEVNKIAEFAKKQVVKLGDAVMSKVAPAVDFCKKFIKGKPALTSEQAFKLVLGQNNGANLYFAGDSDGKYLSVTDDLEKAVDVFAEFVDGNYHIFYLDGEKKCYPTINVTSGDKNEVRIYLKGQEPAATTLDEVAPEETAEETTVEAAE